MIVEIGEGSIVLLMVYLSYILPIEGVNKLIGNSQKSKIEELPQE
jgi:hypothetical protein